MNVKDDAATQQQQQDDLKQNEEAFESAFAETRGSQDPSVKALPNAETKAPQAKADATVKAEAPAAAEEMVHGMPVSKIKAAVELLDRIGNVDAHLKNLIDGRFGEVKRNWIPEAVKAAQKDNPAAGGVTLSPARLKRLEAEYPDLVAALTENLEEAAETVEAKADAGVSKEELEKVKTEAVGQAVAQFEESMLERDHPGWLQVVNSAEFRAFMLSKTPEEVKAFFDSTKAAEIGARIKEFKDAQAKGTAPAAATTTTTAATTPTSAPDKAAQEAAARAEAEKQQQGRRDRMSAAVAPQGAGATKPAALSEEEEFAAGFADVRSNRL